MVSTRDEVFGVLLIYAAEPDAFDDTEILLNLLGNAIKFTDEGTITIALADRGDHLAVSVRDTGIGIAAVDLGSVFQPFHQLEVGLARKHEGTGLGLSICRRLVEMMGGTIRVESAAGVGSRFTFTHVQVEWVARRRSPRYGGQIRRWWPPR